MKNTHFLVFILSTFLIFSGWNTATAQTNEWAPIGAKWVYNYTWCSNDPYCGIVVLESLKDTMVDGLTCRLIALEEIPLVPDMLAIPTEFEPGGPIVMYEDSGKVYMYDNFNEEFYKLFDWTAQVGDTVLLAETNKFRGFEGNFNCHSLNLSPPYDSVFCGPMVYKIGRLDTVQVSGTQRIVQLAEPIYYGPDSLGSGVLFKHIATGIGPLNAWMFGERPSYNLGGLRNGKLLCYSVNDQVVYEDSVTTCSSILGLSTGPKLVPIKVFPNPAGTYVTISWQLAEPNATLLVTDIQGRKTMEQTGLTEAGSLHVKTAHWPTGLYLVTIHHNGQSVLSEYLVISR